MDVTFRGTCFGLIAVFALGCGSGSKGANTYPPEQKSDAAQADASPNDGSTTSKPAPVSNTNSVQVFAGTAQLLSSGAACTSEVGAVGDRWCAFIAVSKTNIGNLDLFVVDVSQAAAGASINCGSVNGDPNCLRLTGGYFEDSGAQASHLPLFRGDTLVYFDRAGTPYGWRPGMANGRVLARNVVAGDIHDCLPAPKGTAIYCLQGPLSGDVIQSDLLVGRLDAPGSVPLARVETVISSNAGDTGHLRFQVGFPTPAGDAIAWSSRQTATGPEILKEQQVDDATTRHTVATDVTRWNTSPDGRQWYWLGQWGTNSGTLQAAPFGDAATPTTLIPTVANFRVAATGAIVSLTSTRVLQGIVDPVGAPTAIVPIDTGVFGIVQISAQGYVAYAKNQDAILQFIDLYVNKIDGTGTRCTLTSRLDGALFAAFVPGSGAILWARSDLNAAFGSAPDGFFTNLSNCRTTTIAPGISGLGAVKDIGVLVADEYDGTDETLRVQSVISGNALGGGTPVLIQTRVDNFLAVSPSSPLVAYTVNAGVPADGVYVYSVVAAASTIDAGAGDTAAAGGGDGGAEAGDDAATGTPAGGDAGTDGGASDDTATGVPGDA